MCIFILSIKGAMKVPNASQTLAPHATYMPEGCQTYVYISQIWDKTFTNEQDYLKPQQFGKMWITLHGSFKPKPQISPNNGVNRAISYESLGVRRPDLPAVVWSCWSWGGWKYSSWKAGEFERKGRVAIHNVWTFLTMMMSHSETCHLIAILPWRLVMHLELTSGVTVKQHEETMYLFGLV